MIRPKVILRVLLDEGVPVEVAEVFRRYGHEAILQKDVAKLGSPDQIVWAAAVGNHAALVAYDKDVRVLQNRAERDDRLKELGVISFRKLPEPMAAKRLEGCMSFIEHEWDYSCQKRARRLALEIYLHHLRTYR